MLVFAYYDCPMLCTLAINGLSSALNVLSLEAGRLISRSSRSASTRATRPPAPPPRKPATSNATNAPAPPTAWHFLTGDQPSIDRLTKAAGFRYAWDQETKQFAHPTGIIVLTPDGRMARYLFGIEYGPRDLRLAIVEASSGKVGSPVDALLLYCYHYDPMTGRYGSRHHARDAHRGRDDGARARRIHFVMVRLTPRALDPRDSTDTQNRVPNHEQPRTER